MNVFAQGSWLFVLRKNVLTVCCVAVFLCCNGWNISKKMKITVLLGL